MTRETDTDRAYEALIEEARQSVRAHDFVHAEHLAREALAHDPERAAACNLLAAIPELQGRHTQAMDLLRAGIAVEPTCRPAQENLARLASFPHHGAILLGDEEA